MCRSKRSGEDFAVRDPEAVDAAAIHRRDGIPHARPARARTLRQGEGRRDRRQLRRRRAGACAEPIARRAAGPVIEAVETEFKRDAYKIVRDLAALEAYIARASRAGAVGLDTEADSFDAARANLVGLSLSLGANDAIYIPLAHRGAGSARGRTVRERESQALALAEQGAAAQRRRLEGEIEQIPLAAALAALQPTAAKTPPSSRSASTSSGTSRSSPSTASRSRRYDDPMLISYALYGGLDDHDKASLDRKAPRPRASRPTPTSPARAKRSKSFDLVPIERAGALFVRIRRRRACASGASSSRSSRANRLITVYETLERPLPPVLAAMETRGDQDRSRTCSRASPAISPSACCNTKQEAYGLAGREFNIGSPKQLGEILFDEMKLPGGAKTKTGAWSTDATISRRLAEEGHDLPRKVLGLAPALKAALHLHRSAGPSDQSANRARAHQLRARLHARRAGSPPTIPTCRTSRSAPRRAAASAKPSFAEQGNVLVCADYSQIELRLLAHVADIPQLKQAFADGVDIHARTASEMFGVPVEGMPKEVRNNAKAINFGIIYGISAFGLARNLGIAREEAAAYIKKYFERFPGIRDYMEETKTFARANGYVKTIFGRRIWVKGIQSKNPSERAFGERQSINAPLQGAAADIIRRAMIRLPDALAKAKLKSRMLLQVHDELVFEAPKDEADELCKIARDVMEAAPEPAVVLSVPLTVEAKAGATWGAAH